MSIADLYDDPTTSENENRYRGFMDTLSGLSSNLGPFCRHGQARV